MSESVQALVARARQFLSEDVWQLTIHPRSRLRFVNRWLQMLVMIGHGFERDQLLLRASALTYVATLSLTPMLAVAFSIVRLFDPSNNLATTAVEYLAAGSPEAQEKILDLVESVNIAGLGSIGAAMFLASSVLGLRHLETTLNSIWSIRDERTIGRRFADYLTIIVIVPLFAGAALSLGATLSAETGVDWLLRVPVFHALYEMGLSQAPKAMLWIAFTFVFWFFPNTKVNPLSAMIGGLLATALFVVAQRGYLGLNLGVAKYNAVFGGFAALPLLLVWLYLCWVIVLIGAELCFAHQNLAQYRLEVKRDRLGPAETESMGFAITLAVARAFRDRAPPITVEDLAAGLQISLGAVRDLLELLLNAGVVNQCSLGDRGEGYQLGRPAETIRICDLRADLRGEAPLMFDVAPGVETGAEAGVDSTVDVVRRVVDDLEQAVEQRAGALTLADLLSKVDARSTPIVAADRLV